MRKLLTLIAISIVSALSGCGGAGLSQQDYDTAKGALEKGLAAWKNGEPAKKWADPNAPIRFVDDTWSRGDSLLEYEIISVRANQDGYAEAIVSLTTRVKTGGNSTSEALYGINVKKSNQVTIGRDPMHNR